MEKLLETLFNSGNHSLFNSLITKDNSPITHLDGDKDDNIADGNSPIERDNSPIACVCQGWFSLCRYQQACNHQNRG